MEGFSAFVVMAIWIAIAAIPVVICALAFLHAARVPQWVWALAGKTQIWWLVGLLLGAGLIPLGLPASIYYFVKIRPVLERIESGDLGENA